MNFLNQTDSIDEQLNFILNGGSNKKPLNKKKSILKSKSKSKSKKNGSKNIKSGSQKKTKLNKPSKLSKINRIEENGVIMKEVDVDELIKSKENKNRDQGREHRQKIIKKSADENHEYISVKEEKPRNTDNTYKSYDIAFLKRLQKSKMESNASDEQE